jgi:hypothetical protein
MQIATLKEFLNRISHECDEACSSLYGLSLKDGTTNIALLFCIPRTRWFTPPAFAHIKRKS